MRGNADAPPDETSERKDQSLKDLGGNPTPAAVSDDIERGCRIGLERESGQRKRRRRTVKHGRRGACPGQAHREFRRHRVAQGRPKALSYRHDLRLPGFIA